MSQCEGEGCTHASHIHEQHVQEGARPERFRVHETRLGEMRRLGITPLVERRRKDGTVEGICAFLHPMRIAVRVAVDAMKMGLA